MPGDIAAVNLKTPDFSAHSEFLLATGEASTCPQFHAFDSSAFNLDALRLICCCQLYSGALDLSGRFTD
jgi:hypothetical protein